MPTLTWEESYTGGPTGLEKKKAPQVSSSVGKGTVRDGQDLSGKTLKFSGHNYGWNQSMKKINFSGATISIAGNQVFFNSDLSAADFSGATLNLSGYKNQMTAFREAKLTGADFSGIIWGHSMKGFTPRKSFFFNGGPGTTSAVDKHLAVTFEGADLSRITGAVKATMIKNLGKFDGKTAIGAKYDAAMLKKSGWTAAELDAAGWQKVHNTRR